MGIKSLIDIVNAESKNEIIFHWDRLLGRRRLGFKVTNADMSCRGFKYGFNKVFTHPGPIQMCANGFHLGYDFNELYHHYTNINGDRRFFIVEFGKNYVMSKNKIVTDSLKFIEEIDPLDYITKNPNKIDWDLICQNQSFTEEFINENLIHILSHKIHLSKNTKLSEDFIDLHITLFNPHILSSRVQLSEDFIRRNADYLIWPYICEYQHLSEDFIMEFEEKVYWRLILNNQTLSDEFKAFIIENKIWL